MKKVGLTTNLLFCLVLIVKELFYLCLRLLCCFFYRADDLLFCLSLRCLKPFLEVLFLLLCLALLKTKVYIVAICICLFGGILLIQIFIKIVKIIIIVEIIINEAAFSL